MVIDSNWNQNDEEEKKDDDESLEVTMTTRDLQKHVTSKKSLHYTLAVKGK